MQAITFIKSGLSILATFAFLFPHVAISQNVDSLNRANGKELSSYPKNLARLHLGGTILKYDSRSGTYAATEAAETWLDDDEATGWTPPTGKQYYLLSLAQPSLMRNFSLSSSDSSGRITVYAGDEKASPESSTWTPILKDVDVADLNEKVPAGSFNRYGRYLLIETQLEQSSPWWSLYVFGREAASEYDVQERVAPVDASSVLGIDVDQSTIIDMANLYSDASVAYVQDGGNPTSWQAMIDESPESFWIVTGARQTGPSFAVQLEQDAPVRRISTMVDSGPGVLEFYLLGERDFADGLQQAAAGGQPDFSSIDLDEYIPVCTLGFDGVSDREAIDFAPVKGKYLLVRWNPTMEGESIKVRQLDVFGDMKFDNHEVLATPAPIAELEDNDGDKFVFNEGKSFKTLLDPIAEGPLDSPAVRLTGAPPVLPTSIPPLLTVPPSDEDEDPEDPEDTPPPPPSNSP